MRLPHKSEWYTQPSVPSRSRIRRQFSYSAVISTGSAGRVYTQATSWSLFGPPRTLTWSDFRLANRGNGRPLPSLWSLAAWAEWAIGAAAMAAATWATVSGRMKQRNRPVNIMIRRNTPGIGTRTEKRSIDVCEAGKPYYDLAANPCYECLS